MSARTTYSTIKKYFSSIKAKSKLQTIWGQLGASWGRYDFYIFNCLLWIFIPWTPPVLLCQFSATTASFGKNWSCTISFCLLQKLIVPTFIHCLLAWLETVNNSCSSPLSMPLTIFPLLPCPLQCFFSRQQSSNSVPIYMETNPHLLIVFIVLSELFPILRSLFSDLSFQAGVIGMCYSIMSLKRCTEWNTES